MDKTTEFLKELDQELKAEMQSIMLQVIRTRLLYNRPFKHNEVKSFIDFNPLYKIVTKALNRQLRAE